MIKAGKIRERVVENMVNPIDFAVLRWFAELNTPAWLDAFMVFWTNDVQRFYVITAVVLLFFKRTRTAGVAATVAVILSAMSVELCWKRLFERVRPYDQFDFVRLLVNPETTFSLPSGHTSMAFAAAIAMCYRNSLRIKIILLCCAAITAFSRLYVGVHYLTDVVAGTVNGTACALLAIFIASVLEKRTRFLARG